MIATRTRNRRRTVGFVAAVLAHGLFTSGVTPAGADPSVPGFTDGVMFGGLTAPTGIAAASDGRLFIAQQGGALRVVKNGALLSTPFVTLPVDAQGERGLLGVALAPGFPSDPRVFVYYTATTPTTHNRLSMFVANGDTASPGETIVTDLPTLSSATNHNGGGIQFASDGTILIGVGENADPSRAQQLTNPFGKVLRVNTNGTIPAGNPFADGGGPNDDRIFAFGFRNPFSLAVEAGTGRVFVNDVGSGGSAAREEINELAAGGNYAWPLGEGTTGNPNWVDPLYDYDHSQGCAIVGGVFYRPAVAQFPPAYVGRYFFADLCGGWIRAFDLSTGSATEIAHGVGTPSAMALGTDGAIYYVDRGAGTLRRLGSPPAPPPRWLLRNSLTSGTAQVDFTFGAQGDLPLDCDWDGDGDDTPGVYRAGAFYLRNSNTSGVTDLQFGYGAPGDIPVCGDWNGDGVDTIGIYRSGVFHLRNTNTAGVANLRVGYGDPGDTPVVGNWDGSGAAANRDTVGVRRADVFYLRNRNTTGVADVVIGYGLPSDRPLVGDWNGDGTDSIGVWRAAGFYLRDANSTGVANHSFGYGIGTDLPVTGDWNGDGTDTIGVVRG